MVDRSLLANCCRKHRIAKTMRQKLIQCLLLAYSVISLLSDTEWMIETIGL